MQELLTHSESNLALAACTQVQELLHTLGVVSAVYGVDGTCWKGPLSPEAETTCPGAGHCPAQALTQVAETVEAWPLAPTACSHGRFCLLVPVRQRRHVIATLWCCLRSLRYQKTEAFERICSRLNLDSTLLVKQGLGDAASASLMSETFKTVLQVLIEKTQTGLEGSLELEALSNSLAQSYEELTLLHRISDGMKITQRPEDFFGALCRDLKEVIEAEELLVLWSDSERGETGVRVAALEGDLKLLPMHIDLLWYRTQTETNRSRGILIDSNVDGPYAHSWPEPIRNLVSVPIRRDEKIMGALAAINKITRPDFDSMDTKLLISVANESAVYLENFRLYQDLQELLIGSLRALTSSIDAKDPYTCGHSERVALISRYLAQQMALEAAEIHSIYLAGLLHDVGKIGVSEAVLSKPGRLESSEFEQIRRHPQIGATILSPIKQMMEVTQAVLTHHERFDGGGYPRGLRGSAIPLTGRIIMLADSFDAMTSNRTYRKALPLATAQAEIRRFSGTQFDPELADIFLHSDLAQLMTQLQANKNGQTGPAPESELN